MIGHHIHPIFGSFLNKEVLNDDVSYIGPGFPLTLVKFMSKSTEVSGAVVGLYQCEGN